MRTIALLILLAATGCTTTQQQSYPRLFAGQHGVLRDLGNGQYQVLVLLDGGPTWVTIKERKLDPEKTIELQQGGKF